jgi:heme exporter protein C
MRSVVLGNRMRRLQMLLWIWPLVTVGLLAYGLHVALTVPPDAEQGNVGRILYYHVPTWVATSFCFLTNLICSVIFLLTRKYPNVALRADALAVSSAEMGVVFCFLGMATGSLWGRPVWGVWWTWDARLTTTLVLWLIYVSYLVLRKVVVGNSMRTLSAVVAIFAYCDVPIVYMATRWWRTQHPAPVFFGDPGSNVAPNLLPAVQWNILAWLAWAVLVVGIRYAAERRRQTTDQETAVQAIEAIV